MSTWKERAKEKETKEGKETVKPEKEPLKEGEKCKELDKREGVDKKSEKELGKGETVDCFGETRERGASALLDLHRRVAVLEAALGMGAPFIGPEERPEVGEAAINQPLDDER